MTARNRELMKGYADAAMRDLDDCLSFLGVMRNVYAGGPMPTEGVEARPQGLIDPVPGLDHPEHRQAIEMIAAAVVDIRDTLETFRRDVM